MKKNILLFSALFLIKGICAQGLLDEIEKADSTVVAKPKKEKVYDTFAGTRLINMHTTESYPRNTFVFIIQHRFGRVNGGFYEFFGLDAASMRFGFEYGILNDLTVGFGRSTYLKTWDGFVKYRILTQTKGPRQMPVSLSLMASAAIDGRKQLYSDGRPTVFSQRMSYAYQLLLARKFTDWLSIQLTPSLVHYNMVATKADKNLLFLMGGGVRFRITPAFSITGEYHFRIGDNPGGLSRNSAGLGFEINTGGHVFQITVTNSQPMFDSGYLRQTTGDVTRGDIHLGFNITRAWGFGKNRAKKRADLQNRLL